MGPLVEVVQQQDTLNRSWALLELGALGPTAIAAIPALVAAFGDGDCRAPDFRGRVSAIQRIDPTAWRSLALRLEPGLRSPEPAIRAGSALVLTLAGSTTSTLLPVLVPLLHEKSPEVTLSQVMKLKSKFFGSYVPTWPRSSEP